MLKQGDLVYRKSYGGDILFKIQETARNLAILKGIDYRLLADSPISDLILARQVNEAMFGFPHERIDEFVRLKKREHQSSRKAPYFDIPGKVLHLDGDQGYLRKSMEIYKELRIPAEGYHVEEAYMPAALRQILPRSRPDILVITGHDGIIKNRRDIQNLNNYKNSYNFMKAVMTARQYERDRDALIIVAGACQSHFEALLQAGANFASSPGRVLIHALDPLYIAAKAAYTSIRETIDVFEVIGNTYSGMDGLGGIETRGSYRRGLARIRSGANANV